MFQHVSEAFGEEVSTGETLFGVQTGTVIPSACVGEFPLNDPDLAGSLGLVPFQILFPLVLDLPIVVIAKLFFISVDKNTGIWTPEKWWHNITDSWIVQRREGLLLSLCGIPLGLFGWVSGLPFSRLCMELDGTLCLSAPRRRSNRPDGIHPFPYAPPHSGEEAIPNRSGALSGYENGNRPERSREKPPPHYTPFSMQLLE